MAAIRTRGCAGIVKVSPAGASGGPQRMFGVQTWEYGEAADREEASEIGECAKTFIVGAVETSGNFQVWWDPSATANQGDMVVAGNVTIEIYPGGTGSGKTKYFCNDGDAVIEEVRRNGGTTGAVASTFNFFVNGSMLATAAP